MLHSVMLLLYVLVEAQSSYKFLAPGAKSSRVGPKRQSNHAVAPRDLIREEDRTFPA